MTVEAQPAPESQPAPEPADGTPAPQPDKPRPILEAVVKTGGVVVVLAATVVTALLELFSTTLRVGGVLIWVAVPAALLFNWALAWFASVTVGRLWAVALPWGLWTAIMFFAAGTRTTEGDYLMSGDDYPGLVMILVGSLTFAVHVYKTIVSRAASVTKL